MLTSSVKEGGVDREIGEVSYVDDASKIKGSVRIVTTYGSDQKEQADAVDNISKKCKDASVVKSSGGNVVEDVCQQIQELIPNKEAKVEENEGTRGDTDETKTQTSK
eukprot:GHVP01064884.1.p2 GENE.GHVP01064884.1~~GHVP01064884.1.p2  ORF type:complete len:107 (+),score=28.20 GHVP01064884.1:2737-3057(+)